jgi:hypothetical protein
MPGEGALLPSNGCACSVGYHTMMNSNAAGHVYSAAVLNTKLTPLTLLCRLLWTQSGAAHPAAHLAGMDTSGLYIGLLLAQATVSVT